MDQVVCREKYGSESLRKTYIRGNGDHLRTIDLSRGFGSASNFFRSVFLPQGYPDSVSNDYMAYQIWDTLQAFCSSITGALAAQAILKGVGVGDENATVLAATMTWLIKDGTSMVGRIAFAWMQGRYLDSDCKRWRFFADILNDVAIFLEILAPYFAFYFTFIVCVAGLCKALVGVAGGATRASLTQHQTRRNNMADVSAKDGSQETLVNLVALLCNLALIPMVTGKPVLIWTLFFIFTILHLYTNYRAVSAVTMETFNPTRLHIVLQRYLSSGFELLTSVKSANRLEPILMRTRRQFSVNLGTSVCDLARNFKQLKTLATLYKDSNYLLAVDLRKGSINIALHEDSDAQDELMAVYQAEVIEYASRHKDLTYRRPMEMSLLQKVIDAARNSDVISTLSLSRQLTLETFPHFVKFAENEGWLTQVSLLCADEWRSRWDVREREWTSLS